MSKKSSPPPMPGKTTAPPASPPPAEHKGKAEKVGFSKPSGEFMPPKLVLVAVEGWGKTTAASQVPDVALLMAGGETGYHTLLGKGYVPEIDCLVTNEWEETLEALDKTTGYKALALDELSGFERQCHEHVCRRDFKGNWKEFTYYHKGYDLAQTDWLKFLSKLEQLGIMVVALSHCTIQTFKDPVAEDHDHYVAALHKYTWALTKRWADAALFGTFITVVDKGKGLGTGERILYTEHRDTHDAKNRYGMPAEIEIQPDPATVWNTIYNHIKPSE